MKNFASKKFTVLAARLGFASAALLFAVAFIAPTAFMQQDAAPTSLAAVDREAPFSKVPMTKPGQPLAPIQLDAPRLNAPEVASNYTFATATNASLTDMSAGTTTLVGANLDDTASAVQNIGFDFYFQGVRFSQFSANSNGLIRLGAVAVQGGSPYKPLAQAGQSLITPYGADQRTVVTTGKVHFKVIGAAPNRTLVVEWLNMQSDFNAGSTADLTYQARLNETTGVIEFVYGSMTMNAAGAADVNSRDPNIGFSSSNTAGNVGSIAAPQSGAPPPSYDGSSATPTANLYTAGAITVLTSGAQGSRRTFTLTPPTPTAPTALSFTGITGTAMTLNWVDSPDETLYAVYRSTDGINYAFDGTAAQNATSYNATSLTPSTTYFWRVFAVSEGGLSTALAGSQSTNAPANITCNGAGGNWSAAGSWTGGVPTNADNVTIGAGCTITVDVTTAAAFNVTVQAGGILQYITTPASTLTISSNATVDVGGTITAGAGVLTTHVLSIGGNLVNNGTLDLFTTAGVGLTFTGAASNTMSGTGAVTDIRTMTLNKGANANVLEITTSNFTVQNVNTDVAGFLTLTGGTLKISGTFTMTNRVFLTAIYVIPAAGGIWLNNPNFTVAGTNTSTTSGNNGLFRLTQGVYTIGLAIADGFETASATSVYIIEGGTLNANGRFDPQGACNFNLTGGTINVAVVGNNRSAFGSFEIFSTAATFNMSGGTINLINPSTGATKDDFSMTATTQNITGGQIVFGGPGAPATSTYGTPFGSFAPNVVVNPTMTWNINNVSVFFRGTTVVNNGAITSTNTNARFDFANANAAMSYSGSGTFGTLAVPFGGVGISSNSLFLITLNSPIVATRNNLFTGGFVNSGQMTLGNGGASVSVVQIGSAGLLTPGGSYDVSPVHNQGTGGQFMIYAQESVLRTTGFEINPTRSLNFLSVTNTNNVSIAGGDLTCTSVAVAPNNALTLTSGRLITNANTVILPNAASVVVRTAGHVDGNLRKNYSAVASKLFEVGTANGFSPVTVNVTAGTFPSDFTVKATQGPQPSVNPATSVQRYWTLTESGDVTATLTFQYLVGDVLGTEANYKVIRVIGGTPVAFPASTVNTVGHNATLAGVSAFSDWTVGEIASPTAAPATISGRVTTTSGGPMAGVTMRLDGGRSAMTITDANGNYRFANVPVEQFYTVTPFIINYHFNPASRSYSLVANQTDAAFTGSRDDVASGNVIDTPEYFVRQHYLDFLGREPDNDGLNFWSNQMRGCNNDYNCLERRMINVSAAYFLSIEFQKTGGLVHGLYGASYGRAPRYAEFIPDTARVGRDVIVNQPDWEGQLARNTEEFLQDWVQRAAFRAAYDNLTNDGYIDALISNTGVSFTDSERAALAGGLNEGTMTRAQVLLRVAQNGSFADAGRNEMFVRMQYFGYLRRDPDDAGFHFWLNKLNEFEGNFERAEMVKAFLVSGEYRDRFRLQP